MKNMKTRYTSLAGIAAIAAVLLSGSIAFAQTTPAPSASAGQWSGRAGGMGMMHRMPGVFGTVSAISGSTLTLSSKGFGKSATATIYSVDASGATVMKDNATSTLSAIAVGDMVMAQGTVSGTSVTATMIRDGMAKGMMDNGTPGMKTKGPTIPSTGEPVVGGNVSAINGSTLTVTNKAGATYAIDTSSAFIEKGNATSSISAVAVGDDVLVQGSVNGTSVSASSVIDQGVPPTMQNGSTSTPKSGPMDFLGSIGGFFRSLFGFF
jgi:hypothetical protein